MKKSFRQMLSLLLTLALIFSLMVPAYAVEGDSSGAGDGTEVTVPADGSASGPEDGSADGEVSQPVDGDASAAPVDSSAPDGEEDAAAALQAMIDALPAPADIDPDDEAQVKAVNDQIAAIYACAEENGIDVEDNETVNAVLAALYPTQMLEGEGVAQIGSGDTATTYATLREAINTATKGDTITLLKDCSISENQTINQTITLELAGYTLSNTANAQIIVSGESGSLTVKDSSGNGQIALSVGTNSTAIEVDGGSFVLESGTIDVTKSKSYAIGVFGGGSATINDGTVTAYYAPISGNNTKGEMNVTVSGGTLTANYGPAIYMPNQASLTITGGTVNGGISLRMGQVTISGGTINAITDTANIDSPKDYYNYSGNAWLPDALYVFGGTYTSDSTYGNSLNLNITGGTFNCANDQGSAVAIYDLGKVKQTAQVTISGTAKLTTDASDRGAYQVLSLADIGVDSPGTGYGSNVGSVSTAISGGTFSGGTELDKGYLAEGFEVNPDGTVTATQTYVAKIGETQYETLTAAINAVPDDTNTTVTLLANADISATGLTIPAGKSVTLDLNGFELKAANTSAGNIDVYGSLTLTDSTDINKDGTGKGKIYTETDYDYSDPQTGYGIIEVRGSFTMESGYINTVREDAAKKGQFAVTIFDGSVVINGGKIEAGWYTISGNGKTDGSGTTADATVTVNGGELVSTADYAIYQPHAGTLTVNGGTVYGEAGGIAANAGTVNVNGGLITSKGRGSTGTWGDGTGNMGNAAISVNARYNDTTLNVTNGTITAEGDAVTVATGSGHMATVAVSGGSFSSEVNEEWCAPGYEPGEKNEETGMYSVQHVKVARIVRDTGTVEYREFAEAYAAAQDDDTITLLADADWMSTSSSITIAKSITIDLNGHTLTPKYTKNGNTLGAYLYLNKTDYILTIEDNSTAKNGKIETTGSYVVRASKGNLVLVSGTLSGLSTRTVYVTGGTFTMNGGTLTNSSAVTDTNNQPNANVLEVSSGTATISGGVIEATHATDPVCGARQSGSNGKLTVTGGTFKTGTAAAIVNSNTGTLTVTGGTFTDTTGPSVSVTAAGTTTIGTDSDKSFVLPELALGQFGVVTVKDTVTVGKLTPVATSNGSTEYTFKSTNVFGGQYGNDFTDYIKGIAYYCEKQTDSSYYKVVPITDEDNDLVIAKITRTVDGQETTLLFGSLNAALAALQNGDTLTLKQDVANSSTTPWKSTASDVTIDLNGHNVTSNNANYGLWFSPSCSTVQTGDTVTITGKGAITGEKYAVYCSTNGSSASSPVYTLNIGSDVTLKNTTTDVDCCPIYLSSQNTRLYLEAAQNQAAYDYTEITNAVAKTTIDDKTYVYYSPAKALNEQTAAAGVVTLLGDFSMGSGSNINLVINSVSTTLDLDNHTLTCTAQQGLVCNGTDLTIKNGTVNNTYEKAGTYVNVVSMTTSNTEALSGKNNSSLKLENVELSAVSSTVTGLTVNGTLTGVQVALEGCKISLTGDNTVGVYFPVKGGELNITDTTITAGNAVQVKGGTVTVKEIESGKTVITSTGPHSDPGTESSGCTNTGDGIYVEDTYGYNPVVYVQSGTVQSTGEGTSALLYFGDSQGNATGKIEVSGGSFSSKVPENYCASGYVPTDQNEGGLFGVTVKKELTLGVSNNDKTVPAELVGDQLTGTIYVKVAGADIAENYNTEDYPTTTLTFGENKGYVFAGWYEDEEGTKPCTSVPSTDAYAKFVDADVLTVKYQMTLGTGTSSEKTNLRLITTVDSLKYNLVGFIVEYTDASNVRQVESPTTKTVYSSMVGYYGTEVNEANKVIFQPSQTFVDTSAYFMVHTLLVYNNYFGTTFTVTPMWTTLDGTTVKGASRDIVISADDQFVSGTGSN